MAKKHGRYADKSPDRVADPGSDYTTPGFKEIQRGPGVERFDPRPARTPERPELKALANARAESRAARKEAEKVLAEARDLVAKMTAPNFDHLRRENAIPATPPQPNAEPKTVVVDLSKISPEQREKNRQEYRDWKWKRNVKDALESQDPRADKTTNASLHVVDTPGGRAKYHAERQRAALEIAKGTKGADRKFALELAKHHGAEKRKAGGGGVGQKRVPTGHGRESGRWTRWASRRSADPTTTW